MTRKLFLRSGKIYKLNINGTIGIYRNIAEKLRGVPSKLFISQLLIALESQTWNHCKTCQSGFLIKL